jgi:hypothetical protein
MPHAGIHTWMLQILEPHRFAASRVDNHGCLGFRLVLINRGLADSMPRLWRGQDLASVHSKVILQHVTEQQVPVLLEAGLDRSGDDRVVENRDRAWRALLDVAEYVATKDAQTRPNTRLPHPSFALLLVLDCMFLVHPTPLVAVAYFYPVLLTRALLHIVASVHGDVDSRSLVALLHW